MEHANVRRMTQERTLRGIFEAFELKRDDASKCRYSGMKRRSVWPREGRLPRTSSLFNGAHELELLHAGKCHTHSVKAIVVKRPTKGQNGRK